MAHFRIVLCVILLLITLPVEAQDNTLRDDRVTLQQLAKNVRLAENQSSTLTKSLEELQQQESILLKDIEQTRYQLARQFHALQALRASPMRLSFLLPDSSYYAYYYTLRTRENAEASYKILLQNHIKSFEILNQKQTDIRTYMERREILAASIRRSLHDIQILQSRRVGDSSLKNQIAALKSEATQLNSFLKGIVSLPAAGGVDKLPLEFILPTSGIVHVASPNAAQAISIEGQSEALVVTPAAGRVVFSGEFRPLGKIVIIDHGSGYVSILRNMGTIFVEEGFSVANHEPIGTLPVKNQEKIGKSPMLYYELRYNDSNINPLTKIAGF